MGIHFLVIMNLGYWFHAQSRVPEDSDCLRTELIHLYIQEVTFGRDGRFVYMKYTTEAYNRQRSELRNKLGIRAMHVKNLLNEPECLRPLFEYIARTRRFETVFGDVTPSKDRNDEAE